MFTLKFYQHQEDGSVQYEAVCCPHYHVYRRANGNITVTAFANFTTLDGVERHVQEVCYIENAAGKTIDTLREPGLHIERAKQLIAQAQERRKPKLRVVK